MVGDKSFYDVCIKLGGSDLGKLPLEYRTSLRQELEQIVETGGCFEDEGFLSTTCNGEVVTIKPSTWFRSRREALELMMMINRLEG
jgi:hypothetical protein